MAELRCNTDLRASDYHPAMGAASGPVPMTLLQAMALVKDGVLSSKALYDQIPQDLRSFLDNAATGVYGAQFLLLGHDQQKALVGEILAVLQREKKG